MSLQRVILLSCGSFNPPTIMHLRMFELARDHLQRTGRFQVIGGIMSPVNDAYEKKDLVPAVHRIEMTRLSLKDNSWVKLSSWEAKGEIWSRTREVIDYHQFKINAFVKSKSTDSSPAKKEDWMPDSLSNDVDVPVKMKILCGADFLDSFNIPNIWSDEDMLILTRDYGLVVIEREGNDPNISIYNSNILYEHQGNVELVREWLSNAISSTGIRRALRRRESIKYMVPDPVIDYISKENLYQ